MSDPGVDAAVGQVAVGDEGQVAEGVVDLLGALAYGELSAFDRLADAEGIDLLVDVNLRAVLHLCRLLVPGMVARDRGHVVNISSIAGAYNFGGNSTYHATKAAVSMLSRQLRVDCFGKRVRVTEICPGRVATDIFAHVHGNPEEMHKRFIEGFVVSSLIFCTGPLTILGSLNDGLGNGADQLYLKSTLDLFAAMAFAASFGWGVAASVVTVVTVQGGLTVVGLALGDRFARADRPRQVRAVQDLGAGRLEDQAHHMAEDDVLAEVLRGHRQGRALERLPLSDRSRFHLVHQR